ncbi:MAG: TonB-dependent receptor [Candidatus Latescibacteria bacterium]|nr:TonB-dependent receptor [Candidatus Latescibacterota bacterium]
MRFPTLPALLVGLIASSAGGTPNAVLTGRVSDAESDIGIGWTILVIEEIERTQLSDAEGRFLFGRVPPGSYTLHCMRLGYHDTHFQVEVAAGDTVHLELRLGHTPLSMASTLVEGEATDSLPPLQEPAILFSGGQLRQHLSRTIAETIAGEPGIAQRSMGPAPSRPVLRGLGGDRLLMLEDGERTGDLSATSSDHAVAIEPMTTQRIEVIRGPRTLLYGSNALAGVVNAVRGYVPSNVFERRSGAVTWQGESVNRGLSGGLDLEQPLGPFSLHLDSSLRDATDISTPNGNLANTDIRTGNASIGLSLVRPWGHIGAGGSLYDSDYGIPPDPLGGHPDGISIDLARQHLESRAEILNGPAWLKRLELHHSFSRYQHGEFEADGSLGIEFGVLTHNSGALAHLNDLGPLQNGAAGLWYEYRNYAAAGLNFTPASSEYAGAIFTYQEWTRGPWAANAGIRFDARRVAPRQERNSRTVGRIEQRDYAGFSAGLSNRYALSPGLSLAASLMRTFRAPGIEELFSEGPHLASYAYEVGNGDLGSEHGLGMELAAEWEGSDKRLHLALFRNQIDGYIFPKNTGQRSLRRADLFLYQTTGADVLMHGAEAALDWHWTQRWKSSATLSYVRGRLARTDEDLPRLPPLQTRLSLTWEATQALSGTAALRLAADQNRPGPFEEPTDGYGVLDLTGQYYIYWHGQLHTFVLTLENAANAVYRRHLNRVKEILPEPGRNLRLLHKIHF